MQGSYWDLDDLLATNERVPCRAEVTGRGLGWLELGARAKRSDLPLGTEMELPWWLATSLPGYVSLLLPAAYRRTYRAHLIADPTTLALPAYYFHVGLALAALCALYCLLVLAHRTTDLTLAGTRIASFRSCCAPLSPSATSSSSTGATTCARRTWPPRRSSPPSSSSVRCRASIISRALSRPPVYATGFKTATEFARWEVRQVSQLRESQELSSVKRKRDSNR